MNHPPRSPRCASRSGVVLIIVIGIAGLLVSVMIAFLSMINNSDEASNATMRSGQARVMLHAACSFILESSRLGYDDDNWTSSTASTSFPAQHREAFGWMDVRDLAKPGSTSGAIDLQYIGPRDQQNVRVGQYDNVWPNVGGTIICPMYRIQRPPYAIRPTVVYNPIVTDPTNADFGYPYLKNPDPQPVVSNGYDISSGTMTPSVTAWDEFQRGDPTPVQQTLGVSWFRVHRLSGSRFVVTCGAGGTMGFRDWNEVSTWSTPSSSNHMPLFADKGLEPSGYVGFSPMSFFGSQSVFESLLRSETRCWYLVQWSGGVRPLTQNYSDTPQNHTSAPSYKMLQINATDSLGGFYSGFTNRYMPAPLGSISFVQRFDGPPKIGTTDPETGQTWNW